MGAMDAAGAHSDRRTNFPRRWPCDLHLARALGCGSRFRHTAHRRPPFGAGMADRAGLGIDNSATRLDVRMTVRTVAAVSPPPLKLYLSRIASFRSPLRKLIAPLPDFLGNHPRTPKADNHQRRGNHREPHTNPVQP